MKYLHRTIIAFFVGGAAAIYIPIATADAALDALNANHLDKARTLLLQQLPNAETKNATLRHLGKVEFHAGNYDKAIDYLQQAIAVDPDSAVDYFLLGKSYGQKAQASSMFSALGLAKKCLASFEKAYSLDSKNTQILQGLVEYHFAAPAIAGGSQEKLLQYSAELKKIAPEMSAIYEIHSLEKDKKHDQAVKLAFDLKQKKNLPVTTQFSLANYFKENKLYSEAEDVLENLIKVPVTAQTTIEDRWYISDASLQLGEVFLATNKQLERAVVLVKDFQAKNNNPKDIHYLWAFWSLAKIYKANGNLDKYQAEVDHIKTLDYKQNKYFAKQFEEESKN
ncbi:MAG: tetratricopeptide repeat protein [Pseudomonadota bacterium]